MRRMTKQCFKCKESKLISEFYENPEMRDGHLGKCKTCTKRDVYERVQILKQDPAWRAKKREWSRRKQAEYRALGKAVKATPKDAKKWRDKNRHKINAHYMANKAQKKGLLEKPSACTKCGKQTEKLHKHHHDYTKPLEVVWLCSPCHGKAHSEARDNCDIIP